jgi:hypothetical protein
MEATEIAFRLKICLIWVQAQSKLPGCANSVINLKRTPVFSFARCVEVDYVITHAFFCDTFWQEDKPLP